MTEYSPSPYGPSSDGRALRTGWRIGVTVIAGQFVGTLFVLLAMAGPLQMQMWAALLEPELYFYGWITGFLPAFGCAVIVACVGQGWRRTSTIVACCTIIGALGSLVLTGLAGSVLQSGASSLPFVTVLALTGAVSLTLCTLVGDKIADILRPAS